MLDSARLAGTELPKNSIDQLLKPELLQLSENQVVAKFDLMKFTPAKRILDDALATGKLKPGGHVIESSSGTFALALAILCSLYGLRLTLVTGPISDVVCWRLENLGAAIKTVHASMNCEGGIQQARLRVLRELIAESGDCFWPQQYTNPLNAESYAHVAEDILETMPRIDTIVGSVGSGGSLFGISKVLRKANPRLRIIAIDHNRSVIFGAEPKRITRMCRETFEQILAMGAGIPMGNVEFERCDQVHWVPVPKMVNAVHGFHRKTGFLVGPSSGAVLSVAGWLARTRPEERVLGILPDHGVRYGDTLFNPQWIERWREDLARDWIAPRPCDSPLAITEDWCVYDWRRQSFETVIGHPPAPRGEGFNP